MKNIIGGVLALFLVTASPASYATVLDFEDMTLGANFAISEILVTSGVAGITRTFTFSGGGITTSGLVEVQNGGLAGGSGNELAVNNLLLEFVFGGPIPGLGLSFGEYGGNLNLDINGDFRNFENFVDINGLTIGGVNVSVVNGLGNDIGLLSLNGTINSFALGGQELWIDNVSLVPVPAAVWLFGTALIGLVGFGRRKAAFME